MTAPGSLWNSSTLPPGSNFWPFFLISAGLKSNVSHWLAAPDMNR